MIWENLHLFLPCCVIYAFFCFFVLRWWRGKRTLGRSLFLAGHWGWLLVSINSILAFLPLRMVSMSNNQSAFLLLLFLLGDLAAFLTYLTGFILIVREDKREEEDRVDEAFWEA